MIGYLSGAVASSSAKSVIIDCNGVGYLVYVGEKMQSMIPQVGAPIKLYTHFSMSPRDGEVALFGFATPEELSFFELLTSISGIGPKSAQSILSKADLQPLQLAIIQGDEHYLRKVAGLGPKTAQRLILELKEKIASVHVSDESAAGLTSDREAIEALMALGYSQYQARDAMKQVDHKHTKSEDKITAALRLLSKAK